MEQIMGWKSIKEYYGIEHNIDVQNGLFRIGSPYIPNIIVFDNEGVIQEINRVFSRLGGELDRSYEELVSDPVKLRELINMKDVFERSIRVFSYNEAEITEHFCENLGYPNATHEGLLMYENRFSTDRSKVIEWALENSESAFKWSVRRIDELTKELVKETDARDRYAKQVETLKAMN
jgi:hypothetical protein